MSSEYEFWLTDDAGRRLLLLKDIAYASYTRTTVGYGTIQLGIPYDAFVSKIFTVFQPDWRLDVHRSPASGSSKRRESSFFIRKPRIYDRVDSVRMIEFFGRNPLDILRRQTVVSTTMANYKKTDKIDDMMKDIVTENFISVPSAAPVGEFSVDAKVGLGPTTTLSFFGRTVLDVLKDLKADSISKNYINSTNRKIYFDVVEGAGLSQGFGYVFRTYADLRGANRTSGMVYSVENGNLKEPSYSEDYLDQITSVRIGDAATVTSPDQFLSRWNTIQSYQGASSDTLTDTARAYQSLHDNGATKSLTATFLNTPGSDRQPRSLYGVDWDLGDLLPVMYAGKNITAEVAIVYVAVDDKGQETVTGSNIVGAT
jgi:hypothetical protein